MIIYDNLKILVNLFKKTLLLDMKYIATETSVPFFFFFDQSWLEYKGWNAKIYPYIENRNVI